MLIFSTLIGRNLSNRKALWKYSKGLFHSLELSRVAGALLLEAGCVDDALELGAFELLLAGCDSL